MKTGLAAAAALLGWGWAVQATAPERTYVYLVGDTQGYLTPCGCAKPMSGGILRRATALNRLSGSTPHVVLDLGGLVGGIERQDELKAEALAEALNELELGALNLTPNEAALGSSMVGNLARLTGGRMVSSTISPLPAGVASDREVGAMRIGGTVENPAELAVALGASPLSHQTASEELVERAKRGGQAAVLLFYGSRRIAREIAAQTPGLAMVVYRAGDGLPGVAERVGETLVVGVAAKGKEVVRVTLENGRFHSERVFALTPDFDDNVRAKDIFRRYLTRVDGENLLDRMPRIETPAFAGNGSCVSCHQDAAKVWEGSAHATALATLEKYGQSRDPDCVGCHVVGLESKVGFVSRAKTPELADVGCEACHGPGADHAARPYEIKMPKLGPESCVKCHNVDHSPGFSFPQYWAKIEHK